MLQTQPHHMKANTEDGQLKHKLQCVWSPRQRKPCGQNSEGRLTTVPEQLDLRTVGFRKVTH